ncbi:MAG TPA: DUF177 domain-containing protein [Phototrophicaceae bacterium]|nr:DUF177 domain-containing protein [Phototrophicaceae bacterium]
MSSYLNNRVLKLNVGFLLSDGPAHNHNSVLDIPRVWVSDDLILEYVRGPLRLSRTKEGILVQAHLHVGANDECYRCLNEVPRDIEIEVEELYGYHSYDTSEFIVSDDAILDLSPLLRAEVIIDTSHRILCREDCKGLCSNCGANLNDGPCNCNDEDIDPRFAALKKLLES